MSNKPWSELVGHRWDWAAAATAEFRSRIDSSSHRYFDDHEKEFTAVLFGPTQVGKTTLLLHLMGVDPSSREQVAGILRARRAVATSSTAAPTRYRWTESERWSLRIGGEEPLLLDDVGVIDRLARLRDSSGAPTSPHAVHEVGIPSLHRAGSDGANPVVLDLPGIWAENAAERELASALARRFVPTAHVVVLVLRANQMTLLDKEQFLPSLQLRQWVHSPSRFRLVLTRAYSDGETRQYLESLGRTPEPEDVRAWLMNEGLDTLQSVRRAVQRDVRLRDRISAAVFPIEYGDSWTDLSVDAPEYHAKVEPLREHFLAGLAHSLDQVRVQDSRYTSLARASETIRLAAEDHQRDLAQQIAVAKTGLDVALRRANRALRGVESAHRSREWADKIDHALNLAAAHPPKVPTSLRTEVGRDRSGKRTGEQARGELDELATRFTRAWAAAWKAWVHSTDLSLARRELSAALPLSRNEADRLLREAVSCCGNCSSRWFTLFADDPSTCIRRQVAGAASAFDAVNDALTAQARDHVAALRNNPKLRFRRRRGRKLIVVSRRLEEAQSTVKATEIELERLVQLEADRAATEEADLAQAQALNGLMRQEALNQLGALDQRLRAADTRGRTETTLLMLLVLKSWYQLKLEEGVA